MTMIVAQIRNFRPGSEVAPAADYTVTDIIEVRYFCSGKNN